MRSIQIRRSQVSQLKSSEVKSNKTKPSEVKTNNTKPSQNQAGFSLVKSRHVTSSHARSNKARQGKARVPGEIKSREVELDPQPRRDHEQGGGAGPSAQKRS